MNFDLLGYNADFKNGNITVKLHQKKYAKRPDIHTLADIFDKSINQLVDLKINDKIDVLPPDIVLQPINNGDERIINNVVEEIAQDIRRDLPQLTDEEKDLILMDLDKLLIEGNFSKNIMERGVAAVIIAKLKGLVNNNPILKDLPIGVKNKFATDLYQRYKEKYLFRNI